MRSAKNLPRSSSASSTSLTASRAWLSLRKASERFDIQCTGRPTLRAADVLGDDPQARIGDPEDRREPVAQGARALRAAAQEIAVGGFVVARGRAARLHRMDHDPLMDKSDAGNVFRRCNGAL